MPQHVVEKMADGRKGVFLQPTETERLLSILLKMGVGGRVMSSPHLETSTLFNGVARRTLPTSGFVGNGQIRHLYK